MFILFFPYISLLLYYIYIYIYIYILSVIIYGNRRIKSILLVLVYYALILGEVSIAECFIPLFNRCGISQSTFFGGLDVGCFVPLFNICGISQSILFGAHPLMCLA